MFTKLNRKSELAPTLRSFDEIFNSMLKQFDPFCHFEVPGENHSFGRMTLDSDDEFITARLPLPGCKNDQISVELENDTLRVFVDSASCRCEEKKSKDKLIRHERHREFFEESVKLPAHVDAKNTKAHCKHGILTIEMPKTSSEKNAVRIINVK